MKTVLVFEGEEIELQYPSEVGCEHCNFSGFVESDNLPFGSVGAPQEIQCPECNPVDNDPIVD